MVLRYPLIMSYECAASACLLSVEVCSDEREITMLDYVRFLKIGPPDCDVWGFPIEIRMMDLHTKYLLLVAAYVLSYPPRQAHGAALGSYVVPRQYPWRTVV